MSSHLLLLLLFALPVSAVFAALAKEEPREQLRSGALMFGAFVASSVQPNASSALITACLSPGHANSFAFAAAYASSVP